jgi:hypothetical protein
MTGLALGAIDELALEAKLKAIGKSEGAIGRALA